MAMNFNAKLQFLGSRHSHELFSPNVRERKEQARESVASIAFQSVHKSNKVGSKLLDAGSCESAQYTQVQELVDKLQWCARKGLRKEARVIHGYVLKADFNEDNLLTLLNHLMLTYMKCLDFESGKILFNHLPKKNVFSWSIMIFGFNQQALFGDGLIYFCKMMDHGILPDGFAYSAVVQSCIGMGSVDLGDAVHAQIIVRGFGSHVVVSTALHNMYAKLGKIEEAYNVFNSMAEYNDISWNAMISGLTANGLHLETYNHFMKMKEQGFVPNTYTLVKVLKAAGMLRDVDKGQQVHECVSELNMQDNVYVGTALIDMYSKCGRLREARSVFDQHFANCGINGPWNAMINGYSLCKCSQEGLQLYVKMCQNNIKSDLYTYCSVFNAIANLKSLRLVNEVHGKLLKSGHGLMNISVENAIADAYSKCGSLEEVEKLFSRMKHRNIVSWTTLLTGYSQCSKWEEALIIFSQMRDEGFTPNDFTLASALSACANLCYLENGRQIHGLACKLGFATVRYIESALTDMYAKGGSIEEAEKVFKHISNPDVVSWTAALSAYSYHGFVAHVLCLFRRMKQMHIKPNSVTLLCVLSACTDAGLVEEGLQYFWSMKKVYGLVPNMKHYACIVDLLGRVGRLNEAFEFIMKMPIEPDETVWQTLLAACRMCGNVDIGEIAAQKILSFYPDYSSTHFLLSDTHMEIGRFENGVDLSKEPGCSRIYLKGRVCKFYAGDTDHPKKDDICAKLEELRRKMKALGHMTDLKYALQGRDYE